MVRTDSVKLNVELGKSLKSALVSKADASCRKLSWQLNYYIQLALNNPPLQVDPGETLDDNNGRMTAYLRESDWNRLVEMAEDFDCNLSSMIRAHLIFGMDLERGGYDKG